MLPKLQLLEQAVADLKARYNITATELANLKRKMAEDDGPRQINDLQHKLQHCLNQINILQNDNKDLSNSRAALERQIEDLYQQNQELTQQNTELSQKNALAISRAEVIQEWLARIDNQTTHS